MIIYLNDYISTTKFYCVVKIRSFSLNIKRRQTLRNSALKSIAKVENKMLEHNFFDNFFCIISI